MPNMTGRPRCRTVEMIGGSSVSYLARTPCVPLLSTLFNRGGNRRAFRLPGEGGDHFHCTVEPSPGHIQCREKHRAREPRNLTHELSHEHRSVHEDVHENPHEDSHESARGKFDSPTVPEGHMHRVTTPEKPRKIPRALAEPRRATRRDPQEPSERPLQSPPRGKFPRRASRRVVPLG